MSLAISTTDDGITTLRLDRPTARNAVDLALQQELAEALDGIRVDEQVRAVILTGTDPAFCAGGDLGRFGERDHVRFRRESEALSAVVTTLEQLDRPVVAAINGLATGVGTQLALAGDVRLASPEAVFLSREGHLGLLPSHGGLARLVVLAGAGVARDLALGGLSIDAEHAHRVGLVSRIVDHDDLLDVAHERARSMLARSRDAYATAKHVLHTITAATMAPGLATEALGQSLLTMTDDHHRRLDGLRGDTT